MIGVIAGGTGLVGRLVVNKLLADSNYSRIISLSRSSLGIENPKLTEVIISDLSQLAAVHDQLGGDAYFCCLGTTRKAAGSKEDFRKVDFVGVVNFARAAKAHDAKSFSLVSARGVKSKSMIFYNNVKGETEEAVIGLGIQSVFIYRPGLLIGERKESRPAEKLAQTVANRLPQMLKKPMAGMITDAKRLAEIMVARAAHPEPGTIIIEAAVIV